MKKLLVLLLLSGCVSAEQRHTNKCLEMGFETKAEIASCRLQLQMISNQKAVMFMQQRQNRKIRRLE